MPTSAAASGSPVVSIEALAPHEWAAVGVMAAAGAPDRLWVLRLTTADGLVMLCGLQPGTSQRPAASDATLAAAILAELLAPGWADRARPLAQPVMQHGKLVRAFHLDAAAPRMAPATPLWRLTVAVLSTLDAPSPWAQAVAALDDYAASVFSA